ncbi:MAG: hypothetical protein R2815_10385 [Flavobacteriales bacterium]|nr:hypothetical protein [Flavobacteriales bacterium]
MGCSKEDGPAQWDVDLLAPLVNTTFTIGDLIDDTLLDVSSDGSVTLLYQSQLFAVDMDTVLKAPDTTFFYGAGLANGQGSVNLPAGFPFTSQNDLTRFDLEDLYLRSLILREGTLRMRLRNEIMSAIIGTFRLPGSTFPDGTNSITSEVGPGSLSNPTYSTQSRDLAGSVFDLRGPAYNDVNTLATSIDLLLDPNGSGATVNEGDSVVAEITYSGLIPQYAKGYFGDRTIHIGPEESDLDLFANVVNGTLDVDDVSLKLRVENGVGVDVQVRLDHLRAMNSHNGASVDLSHTIFQGPVNLNRAVDLGNGYAPSVYTTTMDNTDSNVDVFLETLPDQVTYELDLHLNPLGDISNGNDFLYYDSKLRATLELEVPLRVIANELTLEKILDVDLPGTEDAHGLQSGDLRIFATNGFPFSARFQMDIVDAEGQVVRAVPLQGLIASGVLGANGVVQHSVDSRADAQLDADGIDLLYAGNRLRLRAIFNTADQAQHVRILDSYRMDVKIAAGAHYLVNGDE